MDGQQAIELKDFNTGIADSPLEGHALMSNIDIDLFKGSMRAQKKHLPMMMTVASGTTFIADAPTNICTASATLVTQALTDNGYFNYVGAAVTFTTTGTLPAGLSLATTYFLIYISATTFKVATTYANAQAGTAIDITDAGTGIHTVVPVPVGTLKWIDKDKRSGYIYALDSNGRLWQNRADNAFYLLTGNTLTNASGNGMAIFRVSDGSKTYLFVFRNALMDIVNITDNTALDTPVWNNGWGSLNTAAGTNNRHFAMLGQDNIVYFTDDRYTGSLMEIPGSIFDPNNGSTYILNNQALTLPQGEVAHCLEELGVNLLTGGLTYNKIYPWDRSSISYNLPMLVPERAIYEMRNLGNTVYVFAGRRGNIYYTYGSYVKPFKSIPGYIYNNAATIISNPISWGGSAVMGGAVLIGISTTTTGNSGAYLIYPDGRIIKDSAPYSGAVQPAAFYADDEFYYTGYSGNLDRSSTSRPASGTFAAVYHSEMLQIADNTIKGAIHEFEVQLAKPAATGQIRIGWRRDLSSSFTTIPNAPWSANGVLTSFSEEIGLIDAENVQFQVEFDGDIEIIKMRLHP